MVMIPPFMYPAERKRSKEQKMQLEKQLMATKIMAALKTFQPKRKKK